jgi:hypothetical protein
MHRHAAHAPCAPHTLHASLSFRSYQESGEFGEAILQCAECHQQLDAGGPLAQLRAAPELRALVQRHYYDTLARLDAALQRCCAEFSAEGYSKVRGGGVVFPPAAPRRAAAARGRRWWDGVYALARQGWARRVWVADDGLVLMRGFETLGFTWQRDSPAAPTSRRACLGTG